MPIEIVDLPIDSMVIFHSYVSLPGRVTQSTVSPEHPTYGAQDPTLKPSKNSS